MRRETSPETVIADASLANLNPIPFSDEKQTLNLELRLKALEALIEHVMTPPHGSEAKLPPSLATFRMPMVTTCPPANMMLLCTDPQELTMRLLLSKRLDMCLVHLLPRPSPKNFPPPKLTTRCLRHRSVASVT